MHIKMHKTLRALDKPLVHISYFCYPEGARKRASAQVVFLTERSGEKSHHRNRCIVEMNICLFKQYPAEHLKFLSDGMIFKDKGLLSKDGLHLKEKRKIVSHGGWLNLGKKVLTQTYLGLIHKLYSWYIKCLASFSF